MDRGHDLQDDSWSHASAIVASTARIPSNLPHLVRACWNDLIAPAEFVRLLAGPGLPTRSLLSAAQIPKLEGPIKQPDLYAAVDILGVKASSIILAINCICERTLNSGPATRIWAPLFKEMMSEIEIGYHLGITVEQVGHERGMLIGFSRLAGLALLLIKSPKAFTKWYERTQGKSDDRTDILSVFGCEPYQVSTMLMQQLGLGAEVALATASTLGDLDTMVVERDPILHTWRATYLWLHALKDGNDAPSCETARTTFAELCVAPGARGIPEHLAMLQEQVAEVRQNQSLWTWHLPLPSYEETAQAIVYRANSNASGTLWTKGLVLPDR